MLKILFMGTPDFARESLEAVYKAGYEILGVVTNPDKPKGRGMKMVASPVKEFALEKGLTVYQPEKVRKNEEFIEKLRTYDADIFVVVAFGQLLPKSIIDMPRFGCVNVHASLLPEYRGASPIQWAVIDGCEYSGVTTMKMDEGLDTGDILLVKKVKLDKKETGGSLFDRLSIVGAELLIETLKGLEEGTITPVKQDDSKSSYVTMLKKSMGELDFSKPAHDIECLIRGLNPWPSAYTHYNGKMLKIWDADVVHNISDIADSSKFNDIEQEIQCDANIAPATVCYVDKKRLIVKCGVDYLSLNEVQLEGKKRMKTDAFLLGCRVEAGTVFGAD